MIKYVKQTELTHAKRWLPSRCEEGRQKVASSDCKAGSPGLKLDELIICYEAMA